MTKKEPTKVCKEKKRRDVIVQKSMMEQIIQTIIFYKRNKYIPLGLNLGAIKRVSLEIQ